MFKNSKNYMPTYILIALNVAIYGFTSYLSGNALETSDQVLLQFGQYNPSIWLNGEFWRLFTGMFVHANIAHIVGNMLFLFIYGLRAEDMFDIKEYMLIYFLSGLVGGLLTLFLWPDSLSVGASGAIFGMIGACTIYLRRAIGQSIITALMFVSSSSPSISVQTSTTLRTLVDWPSVCSSVTFWQPGGNSADQ